MVFVLHSGKRGKLIPDRIYRAKILFALNKDLLDELAWLNGVSLKYLKNYQIWYVKQFHKSGPESGDLRSSILIPSCSLEMRAGRGEQVKLTFYIRHHRQVLLESQTHFPNIPEKELDFLMEMFAQDSKNYHVWTYRHWLVRRFNLWDLPREIEDVESLIKADVRNNSAWNHRYMLRFGPRSERAGMENSGFDGVSPHQKGVCAVVDEDLVDAELQYAKEQILRAPENRSPWWYARGVLRAAGRGVQDWEEFARKFVVEGEVRSSHAVELLADVYALKEGSAEKAVEMLTLLKERYDPIRKNYWDYRIQQVVV